ncbi:hypothetical protein EG68_07438 [Paragonimus skrjabini miyazakii]|uniref:BAH domain-containing protein n=1 Tax=Paragonimus skrjabini miyazakii TaxID=59628 RepID=A0A8S9YG96_9TREM|nr:hypothetical protein EG68_07438 [Paragonimus skrjabini miyazakii]
MKRKVKQKKGSLSFSSQTLRENINGAQINTTSKRPQTRSSYEACLASAANDSDTSRSVSSHTLAAQAVKFPTEPVTEARVRHRRYPQPHSGTRVDDHSSESRDHEDGLHVASNSEQDYLNDDDVGAPELVAMHDVSVPPTPTTSVEARHLFDKDTGGSHSQRRLNKRELKAFLKQTKKSRSIPDEKLVATMDELAARLNGECVIELNPPPPKPIRVALSPESLVRPTSPPVRRGFGGRRAGRRGGRRGRGSGKLSTTAIQFNDTFSALPASWIPLMLPYSPAAARPGTESQAKPVFAPWLNKLPDIRVNRFIQNIQHILSQHYSSEAQPTSDSLSMDSSIFKDAKPFYSHSGEPVFTTQQIPATLSNPSFSDLTEPSTASLIKSDSDSQKPVFVATVPLPPSHQVELQDLVQSSLAFIPTTTTTASIYSPRGRYRGRRFRKGVRTMPAGRSETIAPAGSVVCTRPTISTVVRKPKSHPRISRELRGLVTWDAVIAQQKRQQAQTQIADQTGDSQSAVCQPSDPTLAVAESLLAQVAVDETSDGLASRARRTRQFSGSALSSTGGHAVQSSLISETASVITTTTASELTVLETPYRSKAGADLSSVARSGLSTGSSSVTSDLPTTSSQPGLELGADSSAAGQLCPTSLEFGSTEQKPQRDSSREVLSPISQCSPVSFPNETAPYAAKYSPISVDHEPEPHATEEQTQTVEPTTVVSPDVVKSPNLRKRGIGKRKGMGHYRRRLVSVPASQNTPEPLSSQDTPAADIPFAPPVVLGPVTKRRRQAHLTPTPPYTRGSSEVELQTEPVTTECSESVRSQSLSTGATSVVSVSSSTNVRRSSAPRSSALPPRKRYKVGIDSTSVCEAEIVETHDLSEQLEENPSCSPAQDAAVTSLTKPAAHSTGLLSTDVTVLDRTPIVTSKQPFQKRGRGRPARRGHICGTTRVIPGVSTVTPSFVCSSTADECLGNTTIERPKREAAAIGFATLVAANLNNSMPIHGSLDSPSSRVHGTETTVNVAAATAAEVTVDSLAGPTPPHTPSRGRGRPRKPKPIPAGPPLALDDATTPPAPTEVPLSTSRRKRPAVVLSPGGRTFKHVSSRSSTPDVLADATPPSSSYIHAETTATGETAVATRVRRKPVEINPPSSAANAATEPRIERVRKVGRPRLKEAEVKATFGPVPSSAQPLPSATVFRADLKLRTLPGRNSLFEGHMLSDVIVFGRDSSLPCKGPLCDIFLRFLNEPDPCEPGTRLVAPIVYLPLPERYPEFYRFVLSSYSGTVLRPRFTAAFMRRLFPSVTLASTTTVPVVDQAVHGVEFPSLCLASIAKWFTVSRSDESKVEEPRLGHDLALTESELALASLDPSDPANSTPLLDAAVESNEWVRNVADTYGLLVPPLKATAVLNMPNCRLSGTNPKKKSDRRALERGAEVIRCLCGFRVEGGHAMVQCDRCAAWQHLPCLWWALQQMIQSQPSTGTPITQLCQAALVAAQAVGSSYSDDVGGPESTTRWSSLVAKADVSGAGDLPYFCPVCLNLANLTMEYPRSLSAAMAMNDLTAVFSLQETTVEGEHEFWSLVSADGRSQIRTDDYALVRRLWYQCALRVATKRIDFKPTIAGVCGPTAEELSRPTTNPYEYVVIRIYRLWKDGGGKSWMEGGLFLRPYDLPLTTRSGDLQPTEPSPRLWHRREVVYDETSRLVLPLSSWCGRCVVLCPSAYRSGRPADLLSCKEAEHYLFSQAVETTTFNKYDDWWTRDQLFFVCDKLFDRSQILDGVDVRFDEISPGYLKVNTRPYCFLRKPDAPFGRASLVRNFTAAQLFEQDQTPYPASAFDESELSLTANNAGQAVTLLSTLPPLVKKSKGEKLARVVDWLERKRQLDTRLADHKPASVDSGTTSVELSPLGPTQCSVVPQRGRPRGSRGRGRLSRLSSPHGMQGDQKEPTSNTTTSTRSVEAHTLGLCGPLFESTKPEVITVGLCDDSITTIEAPVPKELSSAHLIAFCAGDLSDAPVATIAVLTEKHSLTKLPVVRASEESASSLNDHPEINFLLKERQDLPTIDTTCAPSIEHFVVGSASNVESAPMKHTLSTSRKRKRTVTRKRVASASTAVSISSEEPSFFSDSEIYDQSIDATQRTSDSARKKSDSSKVIHTSSALSPFRSVDQCSNVASLRSSSSHVPSVECNPTDLVADCPSRLSMISEESDHVKLHPPIVDRSPSPVVYLETEYLVNSPPSSMSIVPQVEDTTLTFGTNATVASGHVEHVYAALIVSEQPRLHIPDSFSCSTCTLTAELQEDKGSVTNNLSVNHSVEVNVLDVSRVVTVGVARVVSPESIDSFVPRLSNTEPCTGNIRATELSSLVDSSTNSSIAATNDLKPLSLLSFLPSSQLETIADDCVVTRDDSWDSKSLARPCTIPDDTQLRVVAQGCPQAQVESTSAENSDATAVFSVQQLADSQQQLGESKDNISSISPSEIQENSISSTALVSASASSTLVDDDIASIEHRPDRESLVDDVSDQDCDVQSVCKSVDCSRLSDCSSDPNGTPILDEMASNGKPTHPVVTELISCLSSDIESFPYFNTAGVTTPVNQTFVPEPPPTIPTSLRDQQVVHQNRQTNAEDRSKRDCRARSHSYNRHSSGAHDSERSSRHGSAYVDRHGYEHSRSHHHDRNREEWYRSNDSPSVRDRTRCHRHPPHNSAHSRGDGDRYERNHAERSSSDSSRSHHDPSRHSHYPHHSRKEHSSSGHHRRSHITTHHAAGNAADNAPYSKSDPKTRLNSQDRIGSSCSGLSRSSDNRFADHSH